MPFVLWDTLSTLISVLPNPPLTRDQVKLMRLDNVVGEKALTLEDLGVIPVSVEEIAPTYISCNFSNPVS